MEKEFRGLLIVLKEAKKKKYIQDFALTGALALSALTEPRATRDMDFIVSTEKEKIASFVEWLKFSKGYRLTKHYVGRQKDRIKDLIAVQTGSTSADLIVCAHDIERQALANSITATVYKNTRLKVLSPEYLLILKLLAGSDQDYIDCTNLWQRSIDKRLVRGMAKRLYLDGRLKKVVAKAKNPHKR